MMIKTTMDQMIQANKEVFIMLIKFEVYEHINGLMSKGQEIEVDPNDRDRVNEIRTLDRKLTTYVAAVDRQGIELLIKPSVRRTDWTAEMVTYVHQRCLDGRTDHQISYDIYSKFGIEIRQEAIKKTLDQDTNIDYRIADDLRQQVVAARPTGGSKRKKMTESDEEFIKDKIDYETGSLKPGWTGVAIGEALGFSNSHINTWIRKHLGGYRKDHLRAAVNAGRKTNIYANKEEVEAQIKAEVEATAVIEELVVNNDEVQTPTADVEVEGDNDDDDGDQSADA